MKLKPLPIGLQTFRDIIEGGFLYVDKTKWLYDLVRYPKGVYFLSRPRRFGKSLLISTLNEIFLGNRELFKGLWLYDSPYQWQPHPVIRVDFSLYPVKSAEELKASLLYALNQMAQSYGLTLADGPYYLQFENLIRQLAGRQKVAILIDEYDKPIIDNLDNPAEAGRIREVLKGFYTIIKGSDEFIRFVLLTGVSKFSKVGVFSGLNNLQDLTMDERYGAMLGITQAELERDFPAYIERLARKVGSGRDELLTQIKAWYNGFCFSENCQPVYNPFSLLSLFESQRFDNFWFATGTPTFLVKLLKQQTYSLGELEHLALDALAFSSYEIEDLQPVPLLFQTGYLTIKSYDPRSRLYQLGYPNYEVEHAFLQHLLGEFSPVQYSLARGYLWQLIRALEQQDLPLFFQVLSVFFANLPYDIRLNQEKYYQTIFYLIFKLIGLEIEAEARTGRGRIDIVITLPNAIYLFEFKFNASAAEALAQIKQRNYPLKYQQHGKQLFLVGVSFQPTTDSIGDWLVETS